MKHLLHIKDPTLSDLFGPLRDTFYGPGGYTIDIANAKDPNEYRQKLRENAPDVVLLDSMAYVNAMAEKGSKNTVMEALDALQELARPPVILIPENPYISPEVIARVDATANIAIFDPVKWAACRMFDLIADPIELRRPSHFSTIRTLRL